MARVKQDAAPRQRAPEGMLGLSKGLAVIEAFGESHAPMTVSIVARIAQLHRATARRCLLTLAQTGYLSFDGKYFRPTPRMLRLGQTYMKTAGLPQIAEPFLKAARDELGESVSLAIYDNGNSLFVARAQAEQIVMVGIAVGTRLPAYSCATGRVLLAALSPAALTDYLKHCKPEARTAKTLVDRPAIRKAIEAVRTTRFAITDEELSMGMLSLATPVTNAAGEIVAAISVSAFTARVTLKELVKGFLPVLRKQAEQLGRAL
jgi:IclR family transcriptional regulator, pca regulon regulatory protein